MGGPPLAMLVAMPPFVVRPAVPADAAACAAIYAPYVTDTAVNFEEVPPSGDEMAQRITKASARHAWLVLTEGSSLVGYAYAGSFSGRAAYRWSCESSVYLSAGLARRGGGRALYEALFVRLEQRGYRRVFAGMVLPNDASVGLHRALGFTAVGIYQRVGYKLGAWRDVAWMQRSLGTEREDAPAEIV